jgi:hypothetical protein
LTVGLDASMLILLFDADASAPIDPKTGAPVSRCQERLQHFLNTYSKPKGARIIIPTPALSEFLVRIKPETVSDYISHCNVFAAVVSFLSGFAQPSNSPRCSGNC